MRQRPWQWRRTADRYNPAMTTFMNAAQPTWVGAKVLPGMTDGICGRPRIDVTLGSWPATGGIV